MEETEMDWEGIDAGTIEKKTMNGMIKPTEANDTQKELTETIK